MGRKKWQTDEEERSDPGMFDWLDEDSQLVNAFAKASVSPPRGALSLFRDENADVGVNVHKQEPSGLMGAASLPSGGFLSGLDAASSFGRRNRSSKSESAVPADYFDPKVPWSPRRNVHGDRVVPPPIPWPKFHGNKKQKITFPTPKDPKSFETKVADGGKDEKKQLDPNCEDCKAGKGWDDRVLTTEEMAKIARAIRDDPMNTLCVNHFASRALKPGAEGANKAVVQVQEIDPEDVAVESFIKRSIVGGKEIRSLGGSEKADEPPEKDEKPLWDGGLRLGKPKSKRF